MNWLTRLRSALSSRTAERPKGLGHVEPGPERTTIDAVIWVLVDAQGNYVADADPKNLDDEYDYQVREKVDGAPGRQVVKLTVRLPLPRAVEISC